MREGLVYCVLRYLMKHNPPGSVLRYSSRFEQVPCDRLSLAVRVGGKIDLRSLLHIRSQLPHHLQFFFRDPVGGLEIVLNVHAHTGAKKVSNVTD